MKFYTIIGYTAWYGQTNPKPLNIWECWESRCSEVLAFLTKIVIALK